MLYKVENLDPQNQKSSASGGDTIVSISHNLKTIFSHKFDLQYNNSKEIAVKQQRDPDHTEVIATNKLQDKSSEQCSPILTMDRKPRPMMTI